MGVSRKIDVEGMELDVLLGMQQALEARAFKGVAVEILPHTLDLAGHSPEQIYHFMKKVGYHHIDTQHLLHKYGRINTVNAFFEPAVS